MANSYSNLTVVSAAGPRQRLERFDDVAHLFDPSSSAALICHSRNWLPATLARLAAAYNAADLEYLGPASTRVTLLDETRMDSAIRSIEQILDRISSDPAFFVQLMEQSYIEATGQSWKEANAQDCTEAEVIDALRSSPQLPVPRHHSDNDWGFEEPLTAIGFLKSHLEVLRIARTTGRHAIHARS